MIGLPSSSNSFYLLVDHLSKIIESGDVNRGLEIIHNLVESIITEPLCASNIFASKRLDGACQQIGKINLKFLQESGCFKGRYQHDHSSYVYIVTKIQKSGGHTRVIEDLIRARPGGEHIILATGLAGSSDLSYLEKVFHGRIAVSNEQAPRGNFLTRLNWLQKRLIGINCREVFLFNHHQDSVAVAAIQPEMNLDASYFHHGDHHLCLGVFLSHLKHIDLHPMGYHICRDQLGIENYYVPLTLEDKGVQSASRPFMVDGTLTTCTAARSNKVELPYFIQYVDVVPKLLQATGGRHVHIGKLTPVALFKIRRALKQQGTPLSQFVYIPWVPSVWNSLHEYGVDLYLASFPYGGGLTLIEAMGAGIPVVLHRHIFSRVLSGLEIAYPGVFSWRYPEELLQYCQTVTSDGLEQESLKGREQYVHFHRSARLPEILDRIPDNPLSPPDLSDKFSTDYDEWAFWMEKQLNCKRLIWRSVYRALRHLRAFLQH